MVVMCMRLRQLWHEGAAAVARGCGGGGTLSLLK